MPSRSLNSQRCPMYPSAHSQLYRIESAILTVKHVAPFRQYLLDELHIIFHSIHKKFAPDRINRPSLHYCLDDLPRCVGRRAGVRLEGDVGSDGTLGRRARLRRGPGRTSGCGGKRKHRQIGSFLLHLHQYTMVICLVFDTRIPHGL